MKKFAKILSVLLCVATLVGMIGMVATAAEKTPTKVVYGGLNEPKVGYIDKRNGNFTEALYDAENYPASTMIDGDVWGFCVTPKLNYNQWVQNGGNYTAAIIFDQGRNAVTMSGIEILYYATTRYCPTKFRVEAVTTQNGDWEPIATYTEANTAKYCNGLTATYDFGKLVTVYKLRILVDEFIGKYNDDGTPQKDNWIMQIYEIAPIMTYDGPEVVNVPIAKASMGYYKDGYNWATLNERFNAPFLIDGDKQSYETSGNSTHSWVFSESSFVADGGKYTHAILLDLTEPKTLTQVEVMPVRDGRMWTAQQMVVQVSDEEGNWYTVGTYKNSDWSGIATVTFKPILAHSVRLLCTDIGYIYSPTQTACVWAVGEVYLGCEKGAVANAYPATPDNPANPEDAATVKELPIPDVGYYDGKGNFVSTRWEIEKYGNPANLVDGDTDYIPFASSKFEPKDLKWNGGDQSPAIVFNIGKKPIILKGLHIFGYTYSLWITDFHVDIKTSVDGAWETIATYKDVNNKSNGYWLGGDEYMYYFDETVAAYAMRIIIDGFDKGDGDYNLYQLYEIIPLLGKAEDVAPSEPEVTNPTEPSTKPTETPTKPTETPTKPSETPTEPTQTPTDPVDPTEPTDPVDPIDPTEPTDPVEPTDPAEETDPVEDTEPAEDTEPVEETDPVEETEPQATKPVDETEANETQAPTDAPAASDKDAAEAPKSNAGLIIGIIVGVLAIGAAVYFFVIKKKKA